VRLKYYKDTDSLYIDLSENPSSRSEEVATGVVIDYDAGGNLVGIDIHQASTKVQLDTVTISNLPGVLETDS
jgi:uncharacterized protein YuzE